MPIDPRMAAQVAALRAQGGPTGIAPTPGIPAPMPGGRPMGGPPIPPGPGAAAPQSMAPGAAPGINSGIPTALQPGASALVAGMPQAQERFSQGQRAGVMADELRQGSLDVPMGKMVGRVYVPASITQGGAKLMQAWVARQKEQEQKEERRVASEEMSMLRQGFLDSLKGSGPSEEGTE
jgi:hypothetical protein